MKYIIALLSLTILLLSRDNPFEASIQSPINNNPFSSIYFDEESFYLPPQSREITSIRIEYKTLDGKKEVKNITLNKAINSKLPITIKQDNKEQFRQKNRPAVEFIPFRFIKYRVEGNTIYIYTNKEKIRHFHLPRPFKLVFDFNSNFSFKTLNKDINAGAVKRISTGAHKGFFRVTIILDMNYRYTVEKIQQGYKIILK